LILLHREAVQLYYLYFSFLSFACLLRSQVNIIFFNIYFSKNSKPLKTSEPLLL